MTARRSPRLVRTQKRLERERVHYPVFPLAGLAKWDADVRGNLGDESITLRDNDGVDPVYGLGAQVNLDSFLIRAEYERYDFDSDYKLDAFTASVGWRF